MADDDDGMFLGTVILSTCLGVALASNFGDNTPKDWETASNMCVDNGGVEALYWDRDILCRNGAEFDFNLLLQRYNKPSHSVEKQLKPEGDESDERTEVQQEP